MSKSLRLKPSQKLWHTAITKLLECPVMSHHICKKHFVWLTIVARKICMQRHMVPEEEQICFVSSLGEGQRSKSSTRVFGNNLTLDDPRLGGCPEGAINDNKCNHIQIAAVQCDYSIIFTKHNLHIQNYFLSGLMQKPWFLSAFHGSRYKAIYPTIASVNNSMFRFTRLLLFPTILWTSIDPGKNVRIKGHRSQRNVQCKRS